MPTRFSFLASRLGQTVLVLWVVATLLFLIFRLMPGNPLVAYIDPNFTVEVQQALLRQFGLDQPLHVQYAVFLSNLVRGEFGRSFFSREPVSQVMWQVLPNTLVLTLSALLLAYAAGVVGGSVGHPGRAGHARGPGILGRHAGAGGVQFHAELVSLVRRDEPGQCVLYLVGPGGLVGFPAPPHAPRVDARPVPAGTAHAADAEHDAGGDGRRFHYLLPDAGVAGAHHPAASRGPQRAAAGGDRVCAGDRVFDRRQRHH